MYEVFQTLICIVRYLLSSRSCFVEMFVYSLECECVVFEMLSQSGKSEIVCFVRASVFCTAIRDHSFKIHRCFAVRFALIRIMLRYSW